MELSESIKLLENAFADFNYILSIIVHPKNADKIHPDVVRIAAGYQKQNRLRKEKLYGRKQ